MSKRKSENFSGENDAKRLNCISFTFIWKFQDLRGIIEKLLSTSDLAMIYCCSKYFASTKKLDSSKKKIGVMKDSLRCGYFMRVNWILSNIHPYKKTSTWCSKAYSLEDGEKQKTLLLKYLSKNDKRIYEWAISRKNLDIMKWAKENGYNKKPPICDFIEANDMEIVQWAEKFVNLQRGVYTTMNAAAYTGNILIFEYLREKNYSCNQTEISEAAAQGGNIEFLEYLKLYDYSFSSRICSIASKNGNLKLLKWAFENTQVDLSDVSIMTDGIDSGSIELLEYLVSKGAQFHPYFCHFAAKEEKLHILKWAREQNLPWDLSSDSVIEAIEYGHTLEILRYMVESGAPLKTIYYLRALKSKRLDVLEWLLEVKCPYSYHFKKTLRNCSNDKIIKWAKENNLL